MDLHGAGLERMLRTRRARETARASSRMGRDELGRESARAVRPASTGSRSACQPGARDSALPSARSDGASGVIEHSGRSRAVAPATRTGHGCGSKAEAMKETGRGALCIKHAPDVASLIIEGAGEKRVCPHRNAAGLRFVMNEASRSFVRAATVRPAAHRSRPAKCAAGNCARPPAPAGPVTHKLMCACDACAILFGNQGNRYKRVPRRIRFLRISA